MVLPGFVLLSGRVPFLFKVFKKLIYPRRAVFIVVSQVSILDAITRVVNRSVVVALKVVLIVCIWGFRDLKASCVPHAYVHPCGNFSQRFN